MDETTTIMVVLGGLVLLIVIANDWWKQRLVASAEQKGKPTRQGWYNNKTSWGFVAVLVVVFTLMIYVQKHPELRNRDYGPLNALIQHFLGPPAPLK